MIISGDEAGAAANVAGILNEGSIEKLCSFYQQQKQIHNTQMDHTKDLHVVILKYILSELSDNCAKTV